MPPMLIQLASLKVGSMRTGYSASASFTSTTSIGAHAPRASWSTPSSNTSRSRVPPVNEALTDAAGAGAPAPGAANRHPRRLAAQHCQSPKGEHVPRLQKWLARTPATAPEAGALPFNCMDWALAGFAAVNPKRWNDSEAPPAEAGTPNASPALPTAVGITLNLPVWLPSTVEVSHSPSLVASPSSRWKTQRSRAPVPVGVTARPSPWYSAPAFAPICDNGMEVSAVSAESFAATARLKDEPIPSPTAETIRS